MAPPSVPSPERRRWPQIHRAPRRQVSPLVALMKDQVDALRARGIGADLINSSQTPKQQLASLEAMTCGDTRIMCALHVP